MTGTARTRAPKTNQELMRDVDQRIGKLEHPAATRVGAWTLSTSGDTGNLIASHVDGGSVILSKVPPTNQAPDETVDTGLPDLKLRLVGPVEIPENAVTDITYDTVEYANGQWVFNDQTGAAPGDIRNVRVQVAGLYLIVQKIQWAENHSTHVKSLLAVAGVTSETQETWPAGSVSAAHYITTVQWLPEGAVIASKVWSELVLKIGQSGVDPGSFTTLSVTCLRHTEGEQ